MNAAHRLAIRRLEEEAASDPGAVDRFLAAHAFPLVEGPSVTFVWRGEAEAVNLRHFVFGLPAVQPFARVPGTDLWSHVLELPARSRVEYKIEVVRDGHGEWIEDPLNPLKARDPFGANSVCHGDGYAIPEWTAPDPEARHGELAEHWIDSAAFGRPAKVTLYTPPRFRPGRRFPLLVVHDGSDYVQYAGLKTVLDNLIHRLEIAPLVVALSDPGDRLVEYAADPRHARFVVEELLPWVEGRVSIDPDPSARGLMGASFGAAAALSTAWRHPGRFGRLLLQSGSFAFTDIGESRRGPAFQPIVEFVNAYRDQPIRVAEKVFVSCGQYESLIYENRSLVPLLDATGMEVRYVEARDGHNWENWRDRLREGLSWLYPGPLWMVYE